MILNNRYTKKGLCLGPLEFPQSVDDARQLEKELKEFEAEGIEYKRVATDSQPEMVGARQEISIISSDALDRDSEVMLPSGGDYKNYLKYPLLAWGHDYSIPPIGSAKWVKRVSNQWKGLYEYAFRPESAQGEWFPDTVLALVTQGVLKGKSVGFFALEWRSPSQKEIDTRPELIDCKKVIAKYRVYEVSAVTIPCNPECLVEAVEKGLKLLPELETQLASPWLDEIFEDEIIPVINDIRKEISLPEIKTVTSPKEISLVDIVKSLAKKDSFLEKKGQY